MLHSKTRVWSFYTNDAGTLLRGGAITLPNRGEGDLRRLSAERDAFRKGFENVVDGNIRYRFVHELREGDFVLLHSGRGKSVEVCRVTGPYAFDGAHRRPVRWLHRLLPGDISAGAQRELTYASASALFEVKRYAQEFLGDFGVNDSAAMQGGTAAERFTARWALHRRFMEQRKAVTGR